MLESLSPRWRRLLSSVAYTALVAFVAGLGYLTFHAISERRGSTEGSPVTDAEGETIPLVQFDGFTSRLERSSDAERINVSLRLRLTAAGSLDCQLYVVARNDHTTPKLWGVWPTQGPDGAITAGGHFRGGAKSGEPITLTTSWTRISASILHPPGLAAYETVALYVIGPKGDILLARPFALN
jgi:hypothetical protein